MEKMHESRLTLFNEVILPNDEELTLQEKRAFRGMTIFSTQENKFAKDEMKDLKADVKQEDPVLPKIDPQQKPTQGPTDWLTSKKCKKSKKY